MKLTYYTSDDGIWLACDRRGCWGEYLGWDATPSDAVNAAREHLRGHEEECRPASKHPEM